MTPLKDIFFEALPQSGRALDIGAGKGPFSRMLAEKGFQVTSIDKAARPEDLPETVEWLQLDLNGPLPQLPADSFDAILARNVIQFLEREQFTDKLLPWIHSLLKTGGILAIETFWDRMRYVEGHVGPKTDRPPHPSYYTANQLQELLSDMDIIWTDQFRQDLKDMHGEMKDFSISQIVAKKR